MCIWYMLEICDYSCNIHNWIYYRKTHWNHFVGFFSGVFVWGILNTHIKKKKKNTQKKESDHRVLWFGLFVGLFWKGGRLLLFCFVFPVGFYCSGLFRTHQHGTENFSHRPTDRPLSPAPSLVTVAMRVKLRVHVVFVSELQKKLPKPADMKETLSFFWFKTTSEDIFPFFTKFTFFCLFEVFFRIISFAFFRLLLQLP